MNTPTNPSSPRRRTPEENARLDAQREEAIKIVGIMAAILATRVPLAHDVHRDVPPGTPIVADGALTDFGERATRPDNGPNIYTQEGLDELTSLAADLYESARFEVNTRADSWFSPTE